MGFAGRILVFVLVLGSLPVDLLYTGVLNLVAFILIKKDKTVRDEGLEEEYDSEDHEYELLRRKKPLRSWPLLWIPRASRTAIWRK